MIFSRLFGKQGDAWPAGAPRLYPDINGPQLCDFLTQAEYERILSLPMVMICPFAKNQQQEDNPSEFLFGVGLARLMIRDLMLVPNISVRGPEDTFKAPLEGVREVARQEHKANTTYVTGEFTHHDDFRLDYELWRAGERAGKLEVVADDFSDFLRKCAESISTVLGGQVSDLVRERWGVSRPLDPDSLVRLGYLQVAYEEGEADEKNIRVAEALEEDPSFALLHCEHSDEKNAAHLQRARELDPFDAQTYFSLFIATWKSTGDFEPAAVQYLRRAIELSPGHGKAHMCAPHAAHPEMVPKMITHSEIGYRLLPQNPFAINNYILNLTEANAPREKLLALSREGIASDPKDPENYERMIELFVDVQDFKTALVIAEELHKLYEPEMDERALYCLKQNPQREAMIDSGQYDPVAENRQRIEELQQKAAQS